MGNRTNHVSVSRLRMKSRDCPICGSDDRKLLYTDRNRRDGLDVWASYVRCAGCGMVYLHPIPDFAAFSCWDEIYATGSQSGGRVPRALSRLIWRWSATFDLTEALHSLPHGPGVRGGERLRILDLGCGAGQRLVSFAHRGWEVWGVDMSRRAIEEARARIPESRLVCADVMSVELPANHFEAVRADHVWEHMEDPVGLARRCKDWLTPGGALYLYTPNVESLLQKLFGRYNINSWIPFHVNFFSRETARSALQAAGLSDCAIRTNTHASYFPNTLRQLLNRNASCFDSGSLGWFVMTLAFFSPIALALKTVGFGEELVVISHKPKGDETP